MAAELGAARQRIIRRPRLTAMLENSSARIRLLIAPAGYGKTTLAREWLVDAQRHEVWYQGGPASADVAALAAGVAEAASQILPGAGTRMRDRLGATGHAEEDVDILAALFAEDVGDWPSGVWLVFDDYHYAMNSSASERFVELVTHHTPLQMLITSRRRPSWVSARRILYGEILEIDRRALAMVDAEARAVLGRQDQGIDELIGRARGWPAVLGLAALTTELQVPGAELPDALYEYFAEELFQALTRDVQAGLSLLAAFPRLSLDLATKVLGGQARAMLDDGVRVGALTRREGDFELHPLFREFLLTKLKERGETEIRNLAAKAVSILLREERWDEAFHVIRVLHVPHLLLDLISAALDDLLRAGRIPTLSQWLEFAEANHIASSVIDLAESEIAFRQGHYAKSEALALAASRQLEAPDAKARALIRAAQGAMLDSRDEHALESFREARLLARTHHTRLEALVGEGFAALDLGLRQDADNAFAELRDLPSQDAETRIRQAMAQLVRAARLGGITSAIQLGAEVFPLLDGLKEPMVTASFLNTYGHLLALSARYEDALGVSEKQLAFVAEYRLDFVRPHAFLVSALALSGIREYVRARNQIDVADEHGQRSHDVHIAMCVAALRARISIENHDFNKAMALTAERWDRPGSAAMRAELLAYRCLASACLGDVDQSHHLGEGVERILGLGVEATSLVACATAVCALQGNRREALQLSDRAFATVVSAGAFDCFVTAARACPDFLAAVSQTGRHAALLEAVLTEANDVKLARRAGLELSARRRGPAGDLTPREWQVARLVAQGHTNQMIAQQLSISPATAKVHVRHILEKLGARSRTELAARIATLE